MSDESSGIGGYDVVRKNLFPSYLFEMPDDISLYLFMIYTLTKKWSSLVIERFFSKIDMLIVMSTFVGS